MLMGEWIEKGIDNDEYLNGIITNIYPAQQEIS